MLICLSCFSIHRYRAGPGCFSFGCLRQRGNTVGCKDNVTWFQHKDKDSCLFSVWSPSSFGLECTALQVWGPTQDNKAEKSRVRKGAAEKMWESKKNYSVFVGVYNLKRDMFCSLSQGQQSKQRRQDLPLSSTSSSSSGEIHNFSSVSWAFSRASPPPVGHAQNTSLRRHPNQIPKPPQLPRFRVEEE